MSGMKGYGITLHVQIALLSSIVWSVCMNGYKQNISLVYFEFLKWYMNVLSGILLRHLLLYAIVML